MVKASEIIALCLGAVGLVGTSASTGLPMWRVTAFIQENIIVMETRWEGLWMNCYRQASIRMQCKVYDSLLYLPAELQASRGLMCSAVALSFVGLLIAIPGLHNTACLEHQRRVKALLTLTAGVMLVMAAICVFIPVSWTAHVIIQDFYNPLLIDAQRRELGEALYIGWVAGTLLFVSGLVFLSCRSALDSERLYQPVYGTATSMVSRFHPLTSTLSSVSTFPQQPHHILAPQQDFRAAYSPAVAPPGGQPTFNKAMHHPDVFLVNQPNPRHSTPRNPSKRNLLHAPIATGHDGYTYDGYTYDGYTHNQSTSVQTSQNSLAPLGCGNSRIEPHSTLSHSNFGMYI